MTWTSLFPLLDLLAERLWQASLVGGGAAGLVWLVTRAVPRLAPDLRAVLWWLVAAKALLALLWPAPLSIAVLPPAATAGVEASIPYAAPVAASTERSALPPSTAIAPRSGALERGPGADFWKIPLIASWIAIVCWLLFGDFKRSWKARREIDEAPRLEAGEASELFSELRDRFGAESARLCAGEEEEGARVVGLWRPVVALPPSLASLPSRELRLVLAHELLHVVRGDLWWGLVPALVGRLFFFHPLVLLAGREYRLAREAACDAAVLRRLDTPPREYGRLLLALGAALRPPSAGIGASSSRGHLERRLEMLENANPSIRRRSIPWLIPMAMVCLVPVELVARSQEPGTSRSDEPEEEWTLVEDRDQQPVDVVETTAPTRTRTVTGNLAGDLSFVLLSGSSHPGSRPVWTIHGSSRDVDAAEAHRRGGEDLLFVRRGDGDWVIRDPALVAAAREILEPQRELGAQQAELGAEQAALGARQAELGARQASMGRSQAEVAARQAALAAEVQEYVALEMELAAREIRRSSREEREGEEMELARRELRREREQIRQQRRGVEERMRELERGMRSLGGEQGELGGRQARLGAEQSKLGARQAELGRQQRRAAEKAHREMFELVERAIASGVAERVDG